MKPLISLAMIVRNEEPHLSRCLNSVRGVVDEMVIVDTGSTDGTVEIARRYTDRIYHYPWHGDFSAARNFALTRARGRWILSLDADEELDTGRGGLDHLVHNTNGHEAFFLPLHQMSAELPGSYSRFFVLRLFQNRPCYRFAGAIHEQVVVERPAAVGMAAAPVIRHHPLPAQERRRRRGRNLALLQRAVAADPANPFWQYYLGVEWLGLGRAARALPHLQRACRELDDSHILFRAQAVRALVACCQSLGRLDEAICLCLEETHRYPAYTDLFFDGGLLFEEKGEYEIARRWFQEAVNCGLPPALFGHTGGTESFLSLYHLGYCNEKLGRWQEAVQYYEQALAANPGYIYPLYNLFLILLVEEGPLQALARLRNAGHCRQGAIAAALAGLFFEAGYPDLACACLDGLPLAENRLPSPAFYVYAGRVKEALHLVERHRATGRAFDPGLAVDEVVALILQKEYETARTRALSLWRQQPERSRAVALLNLISLCRDGSSSLRPEKAREPEVIRIILDVLEKCLRFRAGTPGPGRAQLPRRPHHLAAAAIAYLSTLSPEACASLGNYLAEKAGALRRLAAFKFGPAGGLIP
ncbi:glycosyltransferase [Desulfofundulus thermobenzoicus]|uniref:Glycosyltransferase n=1 Tax=Desulfofundulus thermobenzoicus TaxID=29376 RepID=A0A6N7ISZ4_9FIRM|nr:glycosyltransferase [Desulfofundulus thermobenzoicus]MQL52639.1 glycosyltransferase [Desulfofundulus thermobenzoicus]